MSQSVGMRATRACAINYLQEHHPATAGKLIFRPRPIRREVTGYEYDEYEYIWTFSIQLVGNQPTEVKVLVDYTDGVASVKTIN